MRQYLFFIPLLSFIKGTMSLNMGAPALIPISTSFVQKQRQNTLAFSYDDIPETWNSRYPKRVIVTGATTGIGLATAKALASKGWYVTIGTRWEIFVL